jgi:hypothetical protein
MLARADFNQTSRANFAVSHARLFKTIGQLPYKPVHKALLGLAWLETWLRWPLRTLKILDSIDETFSLIDIDGQRLGLNKKVRAGFRKNLLYYQVSDLVTLLTSLDKPDFRRRALVIENEEVLLRERERGPGAIVAGFRIGAYPVIPWVLGSLGFPVSMIVGSNSLVEMGRSLGGEFLPGLNRRIRFTSARDPRVLARSLDILNGGGLACTLAELSPIEFAKTTEVQFLDWTIQVPYGIAYLGAATGRSIVPAIPKREAGPRFRLRFGEPLPPPARDRESIRETTQELYRTLEQEVLRSPEQWIGWPLLASHMGIDLDSGAATQIPEIS